MICYLKLCEQFTLKTIAYNIQKMRNYSKRAGNKIKNELKILFSP